MSNLKNWQLCWNTLQTRKGYAVFSYWVVRGAFNIFVPSLKAKSTSLIFVEYIIFFFKWIFLVMYTKFKVLEEWTQFWNTSLGLNCLIVIQNFAAILSSVLEKMAFECAIFGYFPDMPALKLSLQFWVMGGRMWRCKYVRLAKLPFLYFL